MAIRKQTETGYGITADYWRIIGFWHDIPAQMTRIKAALYLNEEARRADKDPIQIIELTIGGADDPLVIAETPVDTGAVTTKPITDQTGNVDTAQPAPTPEADNPVLSQLLTSLYSRLQNPITDIKPGPDGLPQTVDSNPMSGGAAC